jgi:hypothetical protein
LVHAIVRAGGASVRLQWWKEVLALSGVSTVDVPLITPGRAVLPRGIARLGAVASGINAPETLAWSGPALRRRLAAMAPDGVVVLSLRAFDPAVLPDGVPVVLDYVDRLSVSYRQRSLIEHRRLRQSAWRLLGGAMERVEASSSTAGVVTTAVGCRDAAALGATWLPITLAAGSTGHRPLPTTLPERRWDGLFVGTLDYGPNVAAVRALATSIWPEVVRLRPESSLCIAGRRPTAEVRNLVAAMGAELVVDFEEPADLMTRALMSIAPLPLATGMQIKVLEAAAAGHPLVISPAAAAGLAPGFPARVATVGIPFARQLVDLFDDPGAAAELGIAGRTAVQRCYTHERWAPLATGLFGWPGDSEPAGDR